MLDVFTGDAFTTISLTTAVESLPYVPSRLGELGLFKQVPITTLTVAMESREGKISLIPTMPRGANQTAPTRDGRKLRTFAVPHIPLDDYVYAHEVQNIRSFGSEDATEGVSEIVNDRMESLKQNHETTFEWHRIGAIRGETLDADGTSVIYNWFDEMGITEQTENLVLASGDVKLFAQKVIRKVRIALGATPVSRIRAFCSDTFWDGLITNPTVKTAFDRWQEGAFLRQNPETAFEFAGIFWENYTGGVGNVPFIPAGKCRFVPDGVPGLFKHAMAPADFMETVNTPGKLMYVKQEPLAMNKGIRLHSQSNPLIYCERPKCLVEGTSS